MDCVVCGTELTGRQTKYCSDKCKAVFHKPYYLKYKQNRRRINKKPRYCVVCGKELVTRQRKYCSLSCKKKNYNYNPFLVKNLSTLPIPEAPKNNKCEECGGNILYLDKEYFCSKCGLVVV